ncbi:MAG: carbamoyltransferase C-terminal domain-containing protein, partial [Pseudomonadota bacterium]
ALFSIDLKGEYATTLMATGENGVISKVKEFHDPDSLEGMYAAITDYLGFNMLDGAPKIMGLSTFGDPDKYDLSDLIDYSGKGFRLNTQLVGTVGLRRYKHKSKGHYFSPKLIEMLGPRRAGELFQDPYVHYAAAVQKLYEKVATSLVTHYLSDTIKQNGKLVVAGTGSFNVKLNQRLRELPWVDEVYVHPAAGDSGTAIGAAAWAAARQRQTIKPVRDSFFGPSFSTTRCWQACDERREKYNREKLDDPAEVAARLLSEGHLVAWFQGRMEFGPRALGHRSILGNPAQSKMIEAINKKIKFRESWRYFSPSMLDSIARKVLKNDHPADYLTMTFDVAEEWRERFPSLAYHDGTTRAHVVHEETNPRFHALLKAMEARTGYGIVLNTSLNRPGEAMICSPEDALEMFFGSDLEYLIMENVLVTKVERDDDHDQDLEAYFKDDDR